ncbi:hypothetical protein N2W54_005015 [Lotmaria passim]
MRSPLYDSARKPLLPSSPTTRRAPLHEFKSGRRTQFGQFENIKQKLQKPFGEEPPYERQIEDDATWIGGALFFSWMGTFMRQASKEELTLEGLPRPTRAYRAYNSGTRLSEELQRQQLRRHAWDGYVGARVRVRWDAASDGVLRWVGTVQQYGTPRQLYAGVEWRVAPAQREVGVVGSARSRRTSDR